MINGNLVLVINRVSLVAVKINKSSFFPKFTTDLKSSLKSPDKPYYRGSSKLCCQRRRQVKNGYHLKVINEILKHRKTKELPWSAYAFRMRLAVQDPIGYSG